MELTALVVVRANAELVIEFSNLSNTRLESFVSIPKTVMVESGWISDGIFPEDKHFSAVLRTRGVEYARYPDFIHIWFLSLLSCPNVTVFSYFAVSYYSRSNQMPKRSEKPL